MVPKEKNPYLGFLSWLNSVFRPFFDTRGSHPLGVTQCVVLGSRVVTEEVSFCQMSRPH